MRGIRGASRIRRAQLQIAHSQQACNIELGLLRHLAQRVLGAIVVTDIDLGFSKRSQCRQIRTAPQGQGPGGVQGPLTVACCGPDVDQRKGKTRVRRALGHRLLEPARGLRHVADALLENTALIHGHRVVAVLLQHRGVSLSCLGEISLSHGKPGQIEARGEKIGIQFQGCAIRCPRSDAIATGAEHSAQQIQDRRTVRQGLTGALRNRHCVLFMPLPHQDVCQRIGGDEVGRRLLERRLQILECGLGFTRSQTAETQRGLGAPITRLRRLFQ